jgi:hypothetical protein
MAFIHTQVCVFEEWIIAKWTLLFFINRRKHSTHLGEVTAPKKKKFLKHLILWKLYAPNYPHYLWGTVWNTQYVFEGGGGGLWPQNSLKSNSWHTSGPKTNQYSAPFLGIMTPIWTSLCVRNSLKSLSSSWGLPSHSTLYQKFSKTVNSS